MAEDTSAGVGSSSMYNIGYQTTKADLESNVMDTKGIDMVNTAVQNRATSILAEIKEEEKAKTDSRVAKGKELEQLYLDLDEGMTSLGPTSFSQAQTEVEDLRERMYAAIDADDQKLIAELNVELKNIKQRHSADAENLKMNLDDWGDKLISTEAMTDTDIGIYAGFMNGKKDGTAKEVYEGNPPTLHYQFPKIVDGQQVPEIDEVTGDQVVDENGEPVFETHKYTLEQLGDMTVPKDSAGGEAIVDYTEAQKKVLAETGKPPTANAIKNQVTETIPKDEKKIRDWLWGNPAKADGLNVQGYLFDILDGNHEISPDNQYALYKKMGVEEIGEPDGKYDAEELAAIDKKELVRSIMEVDDIDVSHGIIVEVWTDILQNNINNVPNKDYNKDKTQSLTSNMNADAEADARRERVLKALTDLQENPENYRGYTKKALAAKFELSEADLEGVATGEGDMININSIIADPSKKKNLVTDGGDLG